jgi:tetratricopeptide (TPR) repeat protein
LPVIVLNIYLLKSFIQNEQFKHAFVGIIILMALHTFAWIGVNASEERHLARYRQLIDREFLSNVSRLNYHETMGAFFYARNDMPDAGIYFNNYLEIDSSNTRILANISEVYKRMGDEEKEFRWLKRAAALNSPNPTVYMNLGVLYSHRGDTASAIALNERAIQIDSTSAKAHANLAILNMQQNNYAAAAEHYGKAIEYGLTEHFLYRDAAGAYFFLGRYEESLKYYDEYLALEPEDARTRSVRDQLRGWIKKQPR